MGAWLAPSINTEVMAGPPLQTFKSWPDPPFKHLSHGRTPSLNI